MSNVGLKPAEISRIWSGGSDPMGLMDQVRERYRQLSEGLKR